MFVTLITHYFEKLKVRGQTDRQKTKDIRTCRLNPTRGRCNENISVN